MGFSTKRIPALAFIVLTSNNTKMLKLFLLLLLIKSSILQFEEFSSTLRRNGDEILGRTCPLAEENAQFEKVTQQLSVNLTQMNNQTVNKCNENLEKIEKQLTHMNGKNTNNNTEEIKQLEGKLEKIHSLVDKNENDISRKIENIETLLERLDAKLLKVEEMLVSVKDDQRSHEIFPKSCKQIQENGNSVSGIYTISLPSSLENIKVYCDMETRDGGWTYVLRRSDGGQNFEQNWEEYRNGFGARAGEFWLGLEALHQLTNAEANELLVDLEDWDNNRVYAHYSTFKIGGEEEGYSLKVVGGYSGNAGDGLSALVNMKFTTQDRDQDDIPSCNCAQRYRGGWWHKDCYGLASKLTGVYLKNRSRVLKGDGIHWLPLHDGSLKKVTMMIRPRNEM